MRAHRQSRCLQPRPGQLTSSTIRAASSSRCASTIRRTRGADVLAAPTYSRRRPPPRKGAVRMDDARLEQRRALCVLITSPGSIPRALSGSWCHIIL